ncbi:MULTISPECIES: hypothetical protein [Enterobacter]|jgi:hypothetical protein|uniref:hypothetical protein n=1 Tax=Enterobacter TaxID=547 RepID=UPI0006689E74|nr:MULTISPECIES: hypothetical protein [Enterobacter]MBS6016378.1 hypothetical protein [Enterobacter cloacae]AUM01921.1 hypothetical protein B7P19_01490 [Enterobacter sp. Crenshaw]ELC7380899.1 hypothetical protein [Enterobacter asburiae]MBT1734521.1 hypothetical protein [Enterobacter asburiae]MCK7144401.1 hypothetical protein [Enterobacter asburiae]
MSDIYLPTLISEALLAFSGLFGGVSISFFWQPQRLHQHSRFMAGIIFGGISMGAAVALGGLAARWLKIDLNQADITLGLGYILGAMSNGLIVWLANFFRQHEQRDIFDVASVIKNKVRHESLSPPDLNHNKPDGE